MIGIFGDSYAYEHDTTITCGWPTHLSKMCNEEIENHSLYGTSLAYSYKQFKKQYPYKKYSKIVFICTQPGRQMLVDDADGDEYQLHYTAGPLQRSLDLSQHFDYKEKPRRINAKVLADMENILATYPNTWDFIEDLLTEYVNHSHPNVLVLSIRDLWPITNLGLHNNWEPFGPENNCMESLELGRECHISRQQNIELAVYIKRYFEEGFDIRNTFANVEKYYTKPKTFKEAGFKNI